MVDFYYLFFGKRVFLIIKILRITNKIQIYKYTNQWINFLYSSKFVKDS